MTTNHLAKIGDTIYNAWIDKCHACNTRRILASRSPDYVYGPWAHDGTARLNKEFCRDPPVWMIINLFKHKCWCGRPKSEFEFGQRKYCTWEHYYLWAYAFFVPWTVLRDQIIKRDNHACVLCGRTNIGGLEVDHIRAKCLGGDPWDEDNLRTLCHSCHKKKTKQDMHELKMAQKGQKNMSLDSFS